MGKEIKLGHYKDCVLYVSEPGVGKSIDEKNLGLLSETVLNRILPEYAKIGHVILCGISGRLFGEEQASGYLALKNYLEGMSGRIVPGAERKSKRTLCDSVSSRLAEGAFMVELESSTEGKDLSRCMREYVEMTEGAKKLANARHDALGNVLADQERVLAVRGVNDRPTSDWPLVRDNAVSPDWIKDPKFAVAYLGGSNYNLERDPIECDAPDDLRETKDSGSIHHFLENPFDLFVFSGSYSSVLKDAIHNVNEDVSKKASKRFGFGKKIGLINNRIFIVNNPYMKRPERYIVKDEGNFIVTGLNFGRDKTLLLLDYRNRALNVLKLKNYAQEGLDDTFEVLESMVIGRDGNLNDWDIEQSSIEARRERKLLDAHEGLGTSLFGMLTSPINTVKQRRGLVRRLLPYLVGGAIGATGTYIAMRSGKLEEAVQKYVSEMQTKDAELSRRDKILENLRGKIREIVEEATK